MLKLILPRDILNFIDNNRGCLSRATYIIKCVDYIMNNGITLTTTKVNNNVKFEGFGSREED